MSQHGCNQDYCWTNRGFEGWMKDFGTLMKDFGMVWIWFLLKLSSTKFFKFLNQLMLSTTIELLLKLIVFKLLRGSKKFFGNPWILLFDKFKTSRFSWFLKRFWLKNFNLFPLRSNFLKFLQDVKRSTGTCLSSESLIVKSLKNSHFPSNSSSSLVNLLLEIWTTSSFLHLSNDPNGIFSISEFLITIFWSLLNFSQIIFGKLNRLKFSEFSTIFTLSSDAPWTCSPWISSIFSSIVGL